MNQLQVWDRQLLDFTNNRAIAISFASVKPTEVSREPSPQPSGCTFWKMAAEGKAFYTEASDHFGCAVGAYTHGAELPDPQAKELAGLITTMLNLSYLEQHEAAGIPRRSSVLRYVVYSPLGLSPTVPDLALVWGDAMKLMLLSEASRAAGLLKDSPLVIRPACCIIPECMALRQVVLSFGCVGNRVYTGLDDGEGYVAIPGAALEAVCERLTTVLNANAVLAQFHHERKMQFTTAS
jgi:uncharacterized protein (DUF169 family)